MRNSNRPFIPANDYSEIIELHIITQPHSEVYCGYFRRLVCGNSWTCSHIPPCFHAKPPDFPRLIGPRVIWMVKFINKLRKSISLAPPDHSRLFSDIPQMGAWIRFYLISGIIIYLFWIGQFSSDTTWEQGEFPVPPPLKKPDFQPKQVIWMGMTGYRKWLRLAMEPEIFQNYMYHSWEPTGLALKWPNYPWFGYVTWENLVISSPRFQGFFLSVLLGLDLVNSQKCILSTGTNLKCHVIWWSICSVLRILFTALTTADITIVIMIVCNFWNFMSFELVFGVNLSHMALFSVTLASVVFSLFLQYLLQQTGFTMFTTSIYDTSGLISSALTSSLNRSALFWTIFTTCLFCFYLGG